MDNRLTPISKNGSLVTDVTDRETFTLIVKRLARLIGMAAVLDVARQIPRLVIDDEGNVLGYNPDDLAGTVLLFFERCVRLLDANTPGLAQPAAKPPAPATREPSPREIEARMLTAVSPTRILVVDDQVVFRGGLVRLLESQPEMKVVGEAGTVREAVDKAHELRPDVILMDLGLPDGSGLGATLAILAEMPDTRIVFLTVHDDDEDLFAAIRAGAKGYILKSVSVPDLFSQLRGVMRGEAAISPTIARRILGEFSRIPSTSHAASPETEKLTARELEVVRALAQGTTNREIAEQLAVSENTVRTHVHNVLTKLHLHSRRDLTNYARTHGLSLASSDLGL